MSQQPTKSQQPGNAAASDIELGPAASEVGRRLGKYVITRRLGQGGMGIVFEARDPLLERSVAIKVLSASDFSPDAIERLLREARAVARLNHPHVVAIYEIDQYDTGYYLVMELVSGGSAWERLIANGPLPWREATQMVIGACRGLLAAHQAGLIHRDIKPSNLLLTLSGDAKLADFGLAKRTGSGDNSLTTTGNIVGTPDYMSPEQCRGEKLDDRSDFYSLGATYYALMAGAAPFQDAGEPMQIMYAHCMRPAPDPRPLQPSIPASCVNLLERMLAKEPSQRPQNAAQLLEELEGLLVAGTNDTQRAKVLDHASTAQVKCAQFPKPGASRWKLGAIALTAAIALPVLLTATWNWGFRIADPGVALPVTAEQVPQKSVSSRLVSDLIPENAIAAEGAIEAVAFSLDDRLLAWASKDQDFLKCWNLRTGERFVDPSKYHVHCLAFDTTGRILACGDASDQLRRWDMATGQPLPELNTPQGSVHSIAFSPDGKTMAAGLLCWQENVAALHVWSLAEGIPSLQWPSVAGDIHCVAFSPDSATLVSAGKTGTVTLWDVATRKARHTFSLLPEIPDAVAFSADGRYLAASLIGENRGVLLWDLRDLKPGTKPLGLSGPTKSIGAVAFTPDSQAVVCGAADGIWFWDSVTGKPYAPLPNHQGTLVRGLAFSHDGSVLVVGNYGGTLEVWHRKRWPNQSARNGTHE